MKSVDFYVAVQKIAGLRCSSQAMGRTMDALMRRIVEHGFGMHFDRKHSQWMGQNYNFQKLFTKFFAQESLTSQQIQALYVLPMLGMASSVCVFLGELLWFRVEKYLLASRIKKLESCHFSS